MSKRPPGGSAVGKKGQTRDPNVLYPARPVPIPSPLPEAKRVTTSSHNLGCTETDPEPPLPKPLSLGHGHGPSDNFTASTHFKLVSLAQRFKTQAEAAVAIKATTNQSRLGSALPGVTEKGGSKEAPAAKGKNAKAPPSASNRGKGAAGAEGKGGATATAAAAAASKQPPLDPDLVRALAAVATQRPHPPLLPQKLGRPPTPPLPRRLPVMENQPSTKTHPVSASIEWRYQAATDARRAADQALSLEQTIAFDAPPLQRPSRPHSITPTDSDSDRESPVVVERGERTDSATCMTVAERKWRELLAWEDAQAHALRTNFVGSVDAFVEAAQQCIDDFTKEQTRIGRDIEGLCDRIASESVWWSREKMDRHMVVLRELVEEDAGIKGEVEHTIAWLQEDSAGYMADTVDAFRAKMLAPAKPGEPEPDGLATLLPVRARNLQVLSHRELVRGSSLLLQARRELIPRLLMFDVAVTHRFQTFVAPVVRWVRQEWPKERAKAVAEEFYDLHSRHDWALDVEKQVIDILEATIVRCQNNIETDHDTQGAKPLPLKANNPAGDAAHAASDPAARLPVQLNQAIIEDAARSVYRILSQAQSRLTETVTDACQVAVDGIAECVQPWSDRLVDEAVVAHIATLLNLSSPSDALEPWWIGRALAARVRRVDWQFFIASLRRTAIAALEELSGNARVCRRYAKCLGDLWTSQRAEIERLMRNMDHQLAESQHAHDEELAGLRGDLDKAIDRMMQAVTEVECSNAYEVVKAIMSDLETLYASRARHVSTVVSGVDEGTGQRFNAFQQKWNELLPPVAELASDADKSQLDLSDLRARIAEFERTRRPTQVGFVERLLQANSMAASNSTDGSSSKGNHYERSQGHVIAFSGVPDEPEPGFSGKGKSSKKKKVPMVAGPIAIDFQRPSNVRSTTPTGTGAKSVSPPGSPMGLGLGLLAASNASRTLRPSSSGVESFSLNSPLGVADDVEPLEFQLHEELKQAQKLIQELVRHPAMALHVAIRDLCQMYRTEFTAWQQEMTKRLAQVESSSVFRASNQLSTQAYAHERRGKALHHQFMQKLLSIQATKLAARKVRKEREQQLVAFAGQWRNAVELAEGLLQVYIQRVTNGHVPEEYTTQAIGKHKRLIEKLVTEGFSEVEKTLGPLTTQWNETATLLAQLAATQNADDLRPYSPDPLFVTSGGAAADGFHNPASVAAMTPESRVSAIAGIEGKSAEVSVQVREGIHRITKLKHRLQEAAKSAIVDLDAYMADLEMANHVHTAIVQCKTRIRSAIAADQASHAGIVNELKALAETVRNSLGTHVAFSPVASGAKSKAMRKEPPPPPQQHVMDPATFWEHVGSNVSLLIKAWDMACQRAADVGGSSTAVPSPSGFGQDGVTGVPAWGAYLAVVTDMAGSAAASSSGSAKRKSAQNASKRRGLGLLSKAKKSPESLCSTGSPSSSRSGSRLNLQFASTALPDRWLQQLTTELAQIPFTLTPRRTWFNLQRTWVTIDNLLAAQWSWTVECEARQLVMDHQTRCAQDMQSWLHHLLPALVSDLLAYACQQVKKWVLCDWVTWNDKWKQAVQERAGSDGTRREHWNTKVRTWRPEPTATVEEVMGTATEWTTRAEAENKTWVASTIDATRAEMAEDATKLRRLHALMIAYLALAFSPLTFVAPSASAATLVDVGEWIRKDIPNAALPDFDHALVGIQRCTTSVQACLDTEPARNTLSQVNLLVDAVAESSMSGTRSVTSLLDATKTSMDQWWAGWVDGLDIVVNLTLS